MPTQSDHLRQLTYTGGTVAKPGVYSNMAIRTYHRRDICTTTSISSSGLRKLLGRSPAHYWLNSPLNPNATKDEPSRPMVLGRAMHHLCFDERMFAKHFVVAPSHVPDSKGIMQPWSLNYKSAREWRDGNQSEFTDVLYPSDIPKIQGMAKALEAHPFVQAGALKGYVERSGFLEDDDTGLWLKVRPDTIPAHSGDFVDLKCTNSVDWNRLRATIIEQGYVLQFALMRMVFRKLKIPFHSSTLIFVEMEPPHCVRAIALDENDLQRGELAMRLAIRRFANLWRQWQQTHNDFLWYGPGGDRAEPETMYLPDWYTQQLDDKIALAQQQEEYTHG